MCIFVDLSYSHMVGLGNNKHVSYLADNVCIESMSVTITRRTLDKCGQNIETLSRHIDRLVLCF